MPCNCSTGKLKPKKFKCVLPKVKKTKCCPKTTCKTNNCRKSCKCQL